MKAVEGSMKVALVRSIAFKSLRLHLARRPTLVAAAGTFVVLWMLVAALAPWVSPHDPIDTDVLNAYAGFSSSHILGADGVGRDLLSRLIWGSRTALLGALLVVGFSGTVGILLALTAAWFRGPVDTVLSRVFDVIFAFPGILLALVAVAVLGPGLRGAVIALTIAYIPYIARIVRSEALRQRAQPYIASCSINGLSGVAICYRHLLPNLAPLIVGQLTLMFGYAMVDLAAISYLGLGVQAPTPDWGVMVAGGQQSILRGYPQESVFAGLLIVLMVICVTIIGDRISAQYETSAR